MRSKTFVMLSLILVLTGFILANLEDESKPDENKHSFVSNKSSEHNAKYSVEPGSQRSNSSLEEDNPTRIKINYLPEEVYYEGKLEYKPANISADRVQRIGSINVKPRIEITDVKHPDRVDQYENTRVCVETKSTQPPDIQIIDDNEAVLDYDKNSSGEGCFSIHDDELGEHQYTVVASVEDYEDVENFTLSVREPNIVSEAGETSEGFFRENMAYILLAAFLLAALGFIGRKAS